MPFENNSVKFEIPNIAHGFKKANGLLKLDGEYLEMEYQVKDAVIELFTSDVKVRKIPLRELESVEFKKGWFSAKIILEARSPLTGEPLTAAEYAQLQETLAQNPSPLVASEFRELIFLLQLRRIVSPILPLFP